MATKIKNGQVITAGSIAEQEVVFADYVKLPSSVPTYFIEVISGNIQFAADEAITADHHTWAAGSKIPMTVKGSLHFKASTGTDSFVATV